MSEKYTEIFRLKDKLDAIDLEHTFNDHTIYIPEANRKREHYQILLYDEDGDRIVSIVQGEFTYGSNENKLEIMGLLTPEESECDSVVGYLSADEVYERIMKYYGEREAVREQN